MYRTPLLALYLTAELVIATVFCLATLPGLDNAFNLTELPVEFRAKVFLLACAYAAAALLYERYCVPHVSDDEGECVKRPSVRWAGRRAGRQAGVPVMEDGRL